jgi:hypothetical protein
MSFLRPWENGKKAKEIVSASELKKKRWLEECQQVKKEADSALADLEDMKNKILNEINIFDLLYSSILNKDFGDFGAAKNISEEKLFNFDLDIKKPQCNSASDGLKGVTVGAAAGTGASALAVGSVAALGTASTGTAISSLTGFYAQNAILAQLGGGALSVGGGGIAAGAVTLGAIFAIPAIAIGAFFWDSNGKKTLEQAKAFEHEVNKNETRVSSYKEYCLSLKSAAENLKNALSYKASLQDLNQCLKILLNLKKDWNKFSDYEKSFVESSFLYASVLYDITQLTVLRQDGSLIDNNLLVKSKQRDMDLILDGLEFFLQLKRAS